jgi:hypothetical protein
VALSISIIKFQKKLTWLGKNFSIDRVVNLW